MLGLVWGCRSGVADYRDCHSDGDKVFDELHNEDKLAME